jgi:hypothetical protein
MKKKLIIMIFHREKMTRIFRRNKIVVNPMIVVKMMKIVSLHMTTTTITEVCEPIGTRHLQRLLVKLHLAQQRHNSKASVLS